MTVTTDISTWTHAQYQSATADDIASLTTSQIKTLSHPEWLTTSAVAGFSATQISCISASWNLTSADWLNALSPGAFAAIPRAGIAQFTQSSVARLDTAHIAALTADQVEVLSTAQICVLTAKQIAALSANDIAILSPIQLRAFSEIQIGALTHAQVAALSNDDIATLTPAQVAALGAAAGGGLSSAQIAALGNKIGYLNNAAIGALSLSVVENLSGAQLGSLSGSQIAAMSTTQVEALSTLQIAALSPPQVNSLTLGQLTALGTNVQSLSDTAVAGLRKASLIVIYSELSPQQFAALSSDQRAVVQNAYSDATALLKNLSSSGILSQVQNVVNTGESLFSYDGVLKVLRGIVIGSAGLSQTELADLQTFTKAVGAVNGTDSYVYQILNDMVNGNIANATWTGGATTSITLGNLAVGSSGSQFVKLLDKWFLGTDLPTWDLPTWINHNKTAGTYHVSTAPLFSSDGPQSSEVCQGGVGDCYLISAIIATACNDPTILQSMFTDNGNGTYGVRFYDGNYNPIYVTVNDQLTGRHATSSTSDNWVALLEKAYIGYYEEVGGDANSYSSINFDLGMGWSLSAITGKKVEHAACNSVTDGPQQWDTTVKSKVLAALNSNQEVMFGSSVDTSDAVNGRTDLLLGHMYAVQGYDQTTDKFILRNPWGVSGATFNGIFEMSMNALRGGTTGSSNFFLWTTGSAPACTADPKNSASLLAHAMAATSAPAVPTSSPAGQPTGVTQHVQMGLASPHP